jgi:hypothetical protein
MYVYMYVCVCVCVRLVSRVYIGRWTIDGVLGVDLWYDIRATFKVIRWRNISLLTCVFIPTPHG